MAACFTYKYASGSYDADNIVIIERNFFEAAAPFFDIPYCSDDVCRRFLASLNGAFNTAVGCRKPAMFPPASRGRQKDASSKRFLTRSANKKTGKAGR
jgi:hypothetical protein